MENSNNNNESSKYDNDAEDDGINNLTKIPEGKYITFKEEVDDDINNTKQYFQEGKYTDDTTTNTNNTRINKKPKSIDINDINNRRIDYENEQVGMKTTNSILIEQQKVVVSPSGKVKMTLDRQILYKAVSYIYSKIVTPNEEGGLKDWIKEKAIHFSTPYKEEHFILATEIHKEYESLIETHLYQFCEEENIDYKDFYATLVQAKTVSGMSKTINMLLASASYKKFYKLMHRKWKEYYKDYSDTNNNNSEKIADIEDKNNNRRGSLSPHHVKIVEYNNVNNLLSSSLCRNNNDDDDDDMKPMMNSKK